jgi:hypothetical protein
MTSKVLYHTAGESKHPTIPLCGNAARERGREGEEGEKLKDRSNEIMADRISYLDTGKQGVS